MEVIDAQFARRKFMPWKEMLLMPIGDIQYDGLGTADIPRLQKTLQWGLDNDVYFFGMGDFLDFMSPSNRKKYAQAELYDTAESIVDHAATRLENEILEILKPTKDRWIGMLQGHHYFQHLDGTTTDTRLAKELNAPFLGDCALVRLTFKDANRSANVKLWAHHGHGGSGTLPTAALNRLYHQKVRYPNIRLFMMGHVPQLGHTVTDGLDISDTGEPRLVHNDTHYVLTGGFARGYQQGSSFGGRSQGGYAEKAMMPPAVLGSSLIRLTPERIRHRGQERLHVDIKVTS